MGHTFPEFKYHPKLYSLGIVRNNKSTCNCCGNEVDAYIESMYTAEDVDCICLDCIHNGKAAEKFSGDFIQFAEKVSDNEKKEELYCRTPGYISWQGEHWLACCDDYCEYLGTVGIKELDEFGILEEVMEEYEESPIKDEISNNLVKDGPVCGYLFRCLHCKKHRIWVDYM